LIDHCAPGIETPRLQEDYRFDMNPLAPKIEKAFYLLALITAGAVLALPILGALLPLLSVPREALQEVSLGGRQLWLLGRSLLFSGAVAGSAAALGTATAVLLMGNRTGRKVLTFVLVPLVVTPPSIHGLNWTTTILAAEGWLRRATGPVNLPGEWSAAIMVQTLALFPLAVAIAWAGFAVLEAKLLEAGLVFRPATAVICRIGIRLAGPVLGAGAGVMFLLSLSDYSVPSLFSVNVYALEIFSIYSSGLHPAVALITATPLIAVIVLILGAGLRIGRQAEAMALSRRDSSSTQNGIRVPAALTWIAAVVLLVQLLVPLAVMAFAAGSWKFMAATCSGARGEIGMSLAVSLAASLLSLFFGLAVGRALGSGGAWGAAWWILTIIVFALPAPLVGIGILQMAGRLAFLPEEVLPVWANVVRFLPIAAFVFYALRRRIDKGLLDAAQIFGRSRFFILRRVALPLVLPGLVVAGAVCFSLAMGELGATLLVAPPGKATLIMRLYNLLHYGASRDVASLCLLLSLSALAASAAMTIILNQGSRGIIERHPDA
jgi:iron(III) transport system permease protein